MWRIILVVFVLYNVAKYILEASPSLLLFWPQPNLRPCCTIYHPLSSYHLFYMIYPAHSANPVTNEADEENSETDTQTISHVYRPGIPQIATF